MQFRRLLLALIFACAAAGICSGQTVPRLLQVKPVLASDAAHPETVVKAAVVATVKPGFHINDHKPSLEYLIPTELTVDPLKQIAVVKTIYPKGQLKKFKFADSPLSVYEGTFLVGVLLKVAPSTPPGNYSLHGHLKYQACNEEACFPPTSVPVEFSLKVVRSGVALKAVNQDVFRRIKFE